MCTLDFTALVFEHKLWWFTADLLHAQEVSLQRTQRNQRQLKFLAFPI